MNNSISSIYHQLLDVVRLQFKSFKRFLGDGVNVLFKEKPLGQLHIYTITHTDTLLIKIYRDLEVSLHFFLVLLFVFFFQPRLPVCTNSCSVTILENYKKRFNGQITNITFNKVKRELNVHNSVSVVLKTRQLYYILLFNNDFRYF